MPNGESVFTTSASVSPSASAREVDRRFDERATLARISA